MRRLLQLKVLAVLLWVLSVGCGPKAAPSVEAQPVIPAAPAPPGAAASRFDETAAAWRAAGGMIDWVERDESAGRGGHDSLPACERLPSSAYSPDDLVDPILRITFTRAPAGRFVKLPAPDVPFRVQLEWRYFHVNPPDEVPAKLFEELAAFEHLEGFTLVDGFAPVANFAPLGAAKNLRTVQFIGAPFSIKNVRALAGCEHLTTVRCGGDMFGEYMKELAAVKSLRTFAVPDRVDSDIKAMGVLKNLRRLELTNSPIKLSGANAVGTLTDLRALDLSYGREVNNDLLRELTPLTKLEHLKLFRADIRLDGFEHLKKFPELRSLDLSETGVNDGHMKLLARLPKLRTLCLNRVHMKGTGLADLAALPELESLEWSGGDFSGANADHVDVSGLKRLRRLRIGAISWSSFPVQTTDAQLKPVCGLTELRELSLDGKKWTDAAFAEIARLKHLRLLELKCGEQMTGRGWEQLAGLEHLHTLRLSGEWKEDPLPHIAKLRGLTELVLSGRGVTDAGLKELKGLTKLRSLALGYDEISEDGLRALATQPELEELDLSGVKMPKGGMRVLAGMKSLRRLQLPNEVDFSESLDLHDALRHCRITSR